ncbi:epoxyqueuosine reductase QueH [Geopsychrobacter electrodiphilus]|uniref:epoxyqueuosine reductase QueH n=1 Tax=Geopsychrobacter electrodiphilus TaxID=225196 RepID=UPI000361E0A6|nr:epoxyqueuosine reductase QueH [Geopsychrobacter electrodiphilus]
MNILLHVCCGNCAIFPVKELRAQNHQLTGFFFNHNIHPYQEFRRRLETTIEYAQQVKLPLLIDDQYLLEEFLAKVSSDPARRCNYCYSSRLIKTAQQAAEGGFDAFSTTLLYSRYQNQSEIIRLGHQLAEEYNLTFIGQDFRSGWNEGIRISKEMGLYRQQYCGCIYSEKDRYHPRANAT